VDSLGTLLDARADTLVLGRYRLIECLGAGGFGVVWSAYDEQLQRKVAVKRVWLHTEGAPTMAERAEREAQATARLAHPAIVALYEARAEGEIFYLISELVHGDTLAGLLATDALCDEEVLAVGVALAGALEHAHARGVIHRDVKPQNILVPDDPVERGVAVAKLTDFGGARLAGEDALTRTGDVLGTLAYMAPEQSQGREASAQTDLYSLALVLYEALSGVNPVRGANPADTARRIGEVLPPLAHYRRDLPRELTRTFDRALAPAPNRRGGLPELREALADALECGAPPPAGRARRRSPRGPHEEALVGGSAPTALLASDVRPRHSPRRLEPRAEQLRSQAASSQSHERHERHEQPERRSRSLRIPRGAWMAATTAAVLWQSLIGRPGVALLVLAAAAPLLIPRRCTPQALAGALAPALGAAGVAGVFPVVAGQASSWRARAALGALGYWWLCLAEPLLGRRLWLGGPGALVDRGAWERSLSAAAEHVVGPLLSTGVLLGAALWAAAALLLPWLVRGRSAALDVVAATIWTAALIAAEPLLDHGLPLAPGQSAPRGALLAGILAGALAVAARALRGPV
jgi:eukaryotic-like serine/threonine-protein kinase